MRNTQEGVTLGERVLRACEQRPMRSHIARKHSRLKLGLYKL